MIIRVVADTPDQVSPVGQALRAMTADWGQPATLTPTSITTAGQQSGGKIVDPVSLAALIVSIPSAALAVADLADRITKRRRAQALLDHARHHHRDDRVTIQIITATGPVDLADLDPDQLLALTAEAPDQDPDTP